MLKITAIGNLTADPSIRTNNATGATYAILRIASDRRYKDKDGNKLTDFVSIKVRSPLAERCAEFLKKSDKIAATGDFETIVTDGANTGFLIKASEVEFLTSRKKEESLEDILNADLSLPDGLEDLTEDAGK